MSRIWKEARALAAFLRSRAFALGMLSVVLAFVIFQISTMTNVVYVTDEEGSELHYTMESDPGKIFETYAGQLDQKQTGYRGLSGHYAELNTTRTCKASIQADGGISFHDVPVGTTVGDLLYQQGITYDGNDLLTPDADKPILDGDQITLQRVEYERYTEDEEIPYQTVRKNTSLIRLGRTQTIQQGAEGSKTLTYMRRTVDGRREEVQLLGENVTKPPVTELILIGSEVPVSNLDFDLEVDENGKPLHYSRLLTDQIATGYSARPGVRTASGRYAIPGHVAVNPNKIPYGSKLYIATTDNRFVYGCAIAADTGIGLMANVVDVDLFYETYEESVLNGRRIVDIYVLE